MPTDWFVRGGGKVYGPLDATKLKQLVADEKIDENTEVAQAHNGPWVPASRVRGLFPASQHASSANEVTVPEPQAETAPAPQPSATPKPPPVPFATSWTATGLIWGGVLLLALVIWGLRTATKQRVTAAREAKLDQPVATVESEVLYEMFKQNAIKADSIFKGRGVVVSGEVLSIDKDIFDVPYICLGPGLLGSVRCKFDNDSLPFVRELRKGQQVSIEGIVEGQNMAGQVDLVHCRAAK